NGMKREWSRDAANRPVQIVDEAGHLTAFMYDAGDNFASYTNEYGESFTATYDAHHNPLTVTYPIATPKTLQFAWHGFDEVTEFSNANPSQTQDRKTYNYDGSGNLTSLSSTTGTGAVVIEYSATYSGLGHPLTTTDRTGLTTTYTYDAGGTGQWITVTTPDG